MLRIDAVLRRTGTPQRRIGRLIFGDLELDEDAYRSGAASEEIALSPTEFRLLRYLMLNQDRVVSKTQILDHVWDYDFVGDPTPSRPTSATCARSWTTRTPS